MKKQTQSNPMSPSPIRLLQLFHVGSRTGKIMFFKGLSKKCHLLFAVLSDSILNIQLWTYSTKNADYLQWRMQRGNKTHNNFSKLFHFIAEIPINLINV
jgi:hypothetical protein